MGRSERKSTTHSRSSHRREPRKPPERRRSRSHSRRSPISHSGAHSRRDTRDTRDSREKRRRRSSDRRSVSTSPSTRPRPHRGPRTPSAPREPSASPDIERPASSPTPPPSPLPSRPLTAPEVAYYNVNTFEPPPRGYWVKYRNPFHPDFRRPREHEAGGGPECFEPRREQEFQPRHYEPGYGPDFHTEPRYEHDMEPRYEHDREQWHEHHREQWHEHHREQWHEHHREQWHEHHRGPWHEHHREHWHEHHREPWHEHDVRPGFEHDVRPGFEHDVRPGFEHDVRPGFEHDVRPGFEHDVRPRFEHEYDVEPRHGPEYGGEPLYRPEAQHGPRRGLQYHERLQQPPEFCNTPEFPEELRCPEAGVPPEAYGEPSHGLEHDGELEYLSNMESALEGSDAAPEESQYFANPPQQSEGLADEAEPKLSSVILPPADQVEPKQIASVILPPAPVRSLSSPALEEIRATKDLPCADPCAGQEHHPRIARPLVVMDDKGPPWYMRRGRWGRNQMYREIPHYSRRCPLREDIRPLHYPTPPDHEPDFTADLDLSSGSAFVGVSDTESPSKGCGDSAEERVKFRVNLDSAPQDDLRATLGKKGDLRGTLQRMRLLSSPVKRPACSPVKEVSTQDLRAELSRKREAVATATPRHHPEEAGQVTEAVEQPASPGYGVILKQEVQEGDCSLQGTAPQVEESPNESASWDDKPLGIALPSAPYCESHGSLESPSEEPDLGQVALALKDCLDDYEAMEEEKDNLLKETNNPYFESEPSSLVPVNFDLFPNRMRARDFFAVEVEAMKEDPDYQHKQYDCSATEFKFNDHSYLERIVEEFLYSIRYMSPNETEAVCNELPQNKTPPKNSLKSHLQKERSFKVQRKPRLSIQKTLKKYQVVKRSLPRIKVSKQEVFYKDHESNTLHQELLKKHHLVKESGAEQDSLKEYVDSDDEPLIFKVKRMKAAAKVSTKEESQ